MKRIPLIAALLLVAGLAGCESTKDQFSSRDFNELIPRLMNSTKITDPTQAAASLFNTTSPDERRDAIARPVEAGACAAHRHAAAFARVHRRENDLVSVLAHAATLPSSRVERRAASWAVALRSPASAVRSPRWW